MVPFGSARSNPENLRRRYGDGDLKVCPLCGTLNVDEARECFVCWWSGGFDTNPVHVEIKLFELVERCPELVGLLGEAPRPASRVRLALRRLWRRLRSRLDVRA